MDQKENLIEKDLSLVVVLPGGAEKMTTVHGSKPLMDLLVTLCATYHLNPSSHTLELVTTKRNNIKFKPNALIGTLDAEKIILKSKGEDKNKKTSPQMPEATVRMVINYRKTQKTILRVNPRVALAELLPAICEKCEFDTETTVLLKDVQSLMPLDLSSSLNDYAIREVYARDTKGQTTSPVCPSSPSHAGSVTPGKDKNQKEKENKGLFSLFRKSRKNSDQASAASAPASPVLVTKPRPLSMALPSPNASPVSSPTFPSDTPKKRRAPQPPILVSQSCSVDFSACRTLNDEANTQFDGDQMSGLSRGSSAESSLKRTKRKAPPPPTSHSAVVQEMVPLDENLQEESAANTLEEIMEQEEITPSVMSTTAVDTQGEDSSHSMSADVSLHSQSPDTEIVSTASREGSGEDQSCDLSSDGNQLKTTGDDSATVSDVRAAAGTNSPELVDTNGGLRQFENVSEQPICEVDCSVKSSSLPQPGRQAAEAQVTVQANTETLQEQNGRLVSPVAISTSRLIGEDVQVQTDFTQLPAPPEQHTDEAPSAANAHAPELAGKKNMATSTDELQAPDLKTQTSKTSSCHDSAPSTPVLTQASCGHVTDSEPKPKPSNELTRDYIPKVGMTTYTIVPQKSLEKLRYFEVALTLEAPLAAPEEGPNIGSLQLEESTAAREKLEVLKEKSELHSTVPREDLLNSTATTRGTVDGSISESTHSSSPPSLLKANDTILSSANGASQVEVKGIKIPPATKPKPGSFRLAQHKKTPGYYVTSAAEKNLSASPGSGQREAQGGAEIALPPPPPPPPVPCQEETTGGADIQLSPKGDNKNMSMMRMTRQSSLRCKGQSTGLSLEKLRNFTAPRPYSPTTPSRFAQAVSSAVKRSQSLSHGPKSPVSSVSPSFSPLTRSPPATEPKGSLKPESSEDGESKEVDKGSILQGVEGEPPSFSGIAQMEENSSP